MVDPMAGTHRNRCLARSSSRQTATDPNYTQLDLLGREHRRMLHPVTKVGQPGPWPTVTLRSSQAAFGHIQRIDSD